MCRAGGGSSTIGVLHFYRCMKSRRCCLCCTINPAPTSHSPADDGMAKQCRAQSRRAVPASRAAPRAAGPYAGVSLSQRQDVRVREAAGHGRTRIQYPTVLECRTQRPCMMHHAHACAVAALARPSQTPNVTWRAGRHRQAGIGARERERETEKGLRTRTLPSRAVRHHASRQTRLNKQTHPASVLKCGADHTPCSPAPHPHMVA